MINSMEYDLNKLMGMGTFGSVWLATHKATHQRVALKMVDIKNEG